MSKRDSMRASDADRDQIVQRLHTAATEGRIAAEELEQRVATALKARTYAELDETISDLPRPRNGRRPARRPAGRWLMEAVRANPLLLVFAIPAVAVTVALMVAVTVVWLVLMAVAMILGGRSRAIRGPWSYTRGPWMYTRCRRAYGPPRRGGPRSYWA